MVGEERNRSGTFKNIEFVGRKGGGISRGTRARVCAKTEARGAKRDHVIRTKDVSQHLGRSHVVVSQHTHKNLSPPPVTARLRVAAIVACAHAITHAITICDHIMCISVGRRGELAYPLIRPGICIYHHYLVL